MKRFMLGLAVAGLVLLGRGAAEAGTTAALAMMTSYDEKGDEIGSQQFDVRFDEELGLYIIEGGEYRDGLGNTAIISGAGDPDPFNSFGLSVSDFAGPSSFVFTFIIPVIPCPPGSILKAVTTLSGSFTDGATGDGGSITPFLQPAVLASFTGAPLTGLSDIGGFAAFPGGGSSIYGPFSDTVFVGDPGFTFLGLTAAFTGTGDGDIYTLSGSVVTTCLAIPEPASLVMAGVGLVAGLGVLRRRRAR